MSLSYDSSFLSSLPVLLNSLAVYLKFLGLPSFSNGVVGRIFHFPTKLNGAKIKVQGYF